MSIEPGMLVIPKRGLWQEHPPQMYDISRVIFDKRVCKLMSASEQGVVVQDILTGEQHEYLNQLNDLELVDDRLLALCEHMRKERDILSNIICKGDPVTAAQVEAVLGKIRKKDCLPWKAVDLLNRMESSLETIIPSKCCSVGEHNNQLGNDGARCDQESYEWIEGEGTNMFLELFRRHAKDSP